MHASRTLLVSCFNMPESTYFAVLLLLHSQRAADQKADNHGPKMLTFVKESLRTPMLKSRFSNFDG